MENVHDLIVNELFTYKSVAAFIYLINAGREIEIKYNHISAFISKDGSKKQCSIWVDQTEQAFGSVEDLLNQAVIQGRSVIDLWEQIEFNTLY